ncbi:hypothetical protein MAR_022253 [Mya arenaria]|uniref:Uncharacterized protein n=1 Tax=Mya arenaria TaxID=6604 RepID=A0ABY7DSE7_MYAAR|nr:hypothetical protein MAR_022253 [Mya arenaria]
MEITINLIMKLMSITDKADALNEYFASISTIDFNGVKFPPFDLRSAETNSYFEISELDITGKLSNLDVKKPMDRTK